MTRRVMGGVPMIRQNVRVTTFCVYGAPSEDVVREHAKELGSHDIVAVHEIAGDVSPADFPG